MSDTTGQLYYRTAVLPVYNHLLFKASSYGLSFFTRLLLLDSCDVSLMKQMSIGTYQIAIVRHWQLVERTWLMDNVLPYQTELVYHDDTTIHVTACRAWYCLIGWIIVSSSF